VQSILISQINETTREKKALQTKLIKVLNLITLNKKKTPNKST